MQVSLIYPYAGHKLYIIANASRYRPETMVDPEEPAEFVIEEMKLDGKCAFALIDWESWTERRREEFELAVEGYYIERNLGDDYDEPEY